MEERKHAIVIELDPRYCEECEDRYLPARRNQRFCPGKGCGMEWWKKELRRRRREKQDGSIESNQPAESSPGQA